MEGSWPHVSHLHSRLPGEACGLIFLKEWFPDGVLVMIQTLDEETGRGAADRWDGNALQLVTAVMDDDLDWIFARVGWQTLTRTGGSPISEYVQFLYFVHILRRESGK